MRPNISTEAFETYEITWTLLGSFTVANQK